MAVLAEVKEGINYEKTMHLIGSILFLISLCPVFNILSQGTVIITLIDAEQAGNTEITNAQSECIIIPATFKKSFKENFVILTPEQNSSETIIKNKYTLYKIAIERRNQLIKIKLNEIYYKNHGYRSKLVNQYFFKIYGELNLKIDIVNDEIRHIEEERSPEDILASFEKMVIEDSTVKLKQFEAEWEAEELTNFADFNESISVRSNGSENTLEDEWNLI